MLTLLHRDRLLELGVRKYIALLFFPLSLSFVGAMVVLGALGLEAIPPGWPLFAMAACFAVFMAIWSWLRITRPSKQ